MSATATDERPADAPTEEEAEGVTEDGAQAEAPVDAAADADADAAGDDAASAEAETADAGAADDVQAASEGAADAQGSVEDGSAPAVSENGMVYLDRIGTVSSTWSAEGVVIFGIGLPDAAVQRLSKLGGIEVTSDPDRLADATAVLVSTRAPRAEVVSELNRLAGRVRCPIVALAHTGGEATAVEIMRAGGNAVFAEGNEGALQALVTGDTEDADLVETYARHFGRTHTRASRSRGKDQVTGLPDRSLFDARLADLAASGDIPRVVYLRVLHLSAAVEVLSDSALALLRRRLATQFEQRCRTHQAEIYALDETDFAIVGPEMSPNAVVQLGTSLSRLATTYAPGGTGPLDVALGHAGAEAGADLNSVKELAQRALQVAVVDRSRVVVGPEMLAIGVSATTELEAAQRIIEEVELNDQYAEGHGVRVATLASELARELGYEGVGRSSIELAAHLHHIGKIGLPAEVQTGPDGLSGELLEAYRSHPGRGSDYLAPTAGPVVAAAVRHQREHFDGSGFPDGLTGAEIPVEARILAVAHVLEELTHGNELVDPARLNEFAGTRLDPDIVRVAVPLYQNMRESGEA